MNQFLSEYFFLFGQHFAWFGQGLWIWASIGTGILGKFALLQTGLGKFALAQILIRTLVCNNNTII